MPISWSEARDLWPTASMQGPIGSHNASLSALARHDLPTDNIPSPFVDGSGSAPHGWKSCGEGNTAVKTRNKVFIGLGAWIVSLIVTAILSSDSILGLLVWGWYWSILAAAGVAFLARKIISTSAKWTIAVTTIAGLLILMLVGISLAAHSSPRTPVAATTPTAVPSASPTAVPTTSPTAVPTTSPTAVPTATPTAVPIATPTAVAAAPLKQSTAPPPASTCSASVKFATPGDGGDQTVYVTSTIPNSSVTIVVHYKTTDHTFTATTDGGGSASVTFSIGRPTSGYRVNVDVTVANASCSTSFTPQ
jgi:hypothetical protein